MKVYIVYTFGTDSIWGAYSSMEKVRNRFTADSWLLVDGHHYTGFDGNEPCWYVLVLTVDENV